MKKHRLSIRSQLMLLYTLVVVSVCLIYLPMSRIVREELVEQHRQQARQLFERSMQSFDHSVSQLYTIPDIMQKNSYYRESVVTRKGQANALPKLYMTAQMLTRYLNAIPMVDKSFVLFKSMDSVIDNAQLYITTSEFADYGLVFEDGTVEDVLAVLRSESATHALPLMSLRGSAPERGMMILMDRRNSSVRIGAIYKESTIAEMFNLAGYDGAVQLTVADEDGVVFYTLGDEQHEAVTFSGWTSAPHVKVTLSIPQAHFDNIMVSYDTMSRTTLMTAIVVGVLLSLILTRYNYRPVKQLMQRVDAQFMRQSSNEYELIDEYIQNRDNQVDELGVKVKSLRTHLRSHLFARLLNSSLPAQSDKDLAASLLPELQEPHCLVVIHIHTAHSQEPLVFAPFDFLQPFAQEGIFQQTGYHQAALLLHEDNLPQLEALINDQQGRMNEYGLTVCAGVSEVVTGLDALCIAYHQAELAVSRRQLWRRFSGDDATAKTALWNLRDLQKMYEMMLAGEADGVEEMLEQLQKTEGIELVRLHEMVCFVISTVQSDLHMSQTVAPPKNVRHMSAVQVIDDLREKQRDLAQRIQAMRERGDAETKQRVISHIQEHFTSPGCCAETIAVSEHVSTNTVYSIVREQHGCSLGEYIEELRLALACDLLANSETPVSDIGQKCGWPVSATFYRAFKRGRGTTPTNYRANNVPSAKK